ncbi:molybdate ABC transporter substrate-binding protein [Synechocystis sp. CS-94]|nr:molybdate ABC transporter substrate-binding protein [Synechocystis sp. CS-94]
MLGALYQLNSSSPDLETSAPATTETIRLTVSAAASLQTAMEALDPTFASAHPTIEVNYNFAASGTLQRQIEQGATVDLFISAAPKHMDALQGKNLILKDTRRNLLSNSLVLVVPQDSTLKIREFRQLTDPAVKRISLGEPRSVPAGQYGVEVFTNLGILPQLKPKFVYGNSVRNVLSTVESGNADAGIVYATDAQISAQVTTVTTAPADLHTPIVYPIAVMAASVHPEAAQIYSKFLTSKAAQNVFSQYGFSPSE